MPLFWILLYWYSSMDGRGWQSGWRGQKMIILYLCEEKSFLKNLMPSICIFRTHHNEVFSFFVEFKKQELCWFFTADDELNTVNSKQIQYLRIFFQVVLLEKTDLLYFVPVELRVFLCFHDNTIVTVLIAFCWGFWLADFRFVLWYS